MQLFVDNESHDGLPETLGSLVQPVKVFNPEAFCEICQKEFCNKYYLQTHRATKHGIPSTASSTFTGLPRSSNTSVSIMSSGLGAQQQPQSSVAGLSFPGLQPHLINNALNVQAQPSALDMQQLMLASLDPTMSNNPLRALYLSQLAALSNQNSQSEPSPPSSSAAANSVSNAMATTSLSPVFDLMAQSNTADAQAALNAINLAGLAGASTSDPSPTSGATTSQTGEPATPAGSNAGELPNWFTGLLPGVNSAVSSCNPLQSSSNPLTQPSTSLPSLLEQMQLMSAQMMSGGIGPGVGSLPTPPLNALAAALGQPPSSSGAPPLTPNSAAALFAAAGNYGSPAKDAYCELCDKNFCNRYFLRTHRQKKHGITDDVQSPLKAFPPSPANSSQLSALTPSTSNSLGSVQFPANLAALMAACGGQAVTPNSPSSISVSQPTSVIVNGSGSGSPNAKLMKLDAAENESNEDADEDTENGNRTPVDSQLPAPVGTPTASEKPSTCDLCNKSFPALFPLLAHKAREHSPMGSTPTPVQDSVTQRTPVKNNAPSPGSGEEKIACEMCEKEFESRQYLQQHILLHHSGIANASSLLGSLLPGGLPLPFMLPSGLPQNFQMPDVDQVNLLANINGQLSTQKQAVKRQYSSSGKNYCDLCNKEVCNKYFLRTHMLKMHGIVIDDNKTVIANIDILEKEKMGSLSFRCDICMMELKSRHLLRSHKQEVHGVVPIHTPPNSQNRTPKHSTSSTPNVFINQQTPVLNGQIPEKMLGANETQVERCPVCDMSCRSAAHLQEHLQEKHGSDLSSEILESFQKAAQEKVAMLMRAQQQAAEALLLAQQHNSSVTNAFKCRLCSETFTDEVQRHMHAIHKHSNELRAQRGEVRSDLHKADSTSPIQQMDISTVKCPQPLCDYRTPHAENLAIHIQKHTPLDEILSSMQAQTVPTTMSAASESARSMNDEDEEDEAMQATTEVALQMAKANEQKSTPCPIPSCQRRYHDVNALQKHIAKVHRWQLKISPKKPSNGVISPSKIVKLTKRYTCVFPKCHLRFTTRQICREHVASHVRSHTTEEQEQPAETSQNSTATELDTYVREEEEHVVKDIRERLARNDHQKEQERHSHTSGSISPISEHIPEGFARPTDEASQKPYTVQSFVMRERSSEGASSVKGAVLQEMVAHLPVRTLITEPVRITVELVPAPHIDAQVIHV